MKTAWNLLTVALFKAAADLRQGPLGTVQLAENAAAAVV